MLVPVPRRIRMSSVANSAFENRDLFLADKEINYTIPVAPVHSCCRKNHLLLINLNAILLYELIQTNFSFH